MIPKFRAWDKYTSDMVKIKTIDLETDGSIGCVVDYSDIYLDASECDLMQYTGLKDKNGVEIYEGDILLIDDDGYETTISEVTWGGEEYPAFDIPKYDGDTMNGFAAIYFSDLDITMEVIGNIYENPELL